MRALIYVRQSLDASGDELGIKRQEAECRRLCRAREWTVTSVISDNSVSASTGKRHGYQQVLDMIERKECDVVVVYRLDRLMRRLTELEQLIELSERTGVLVATVQGDLDLTNSSGRLVGRILASVARAEVETKSERHRLANAQKAAAGKPHGSRRPYGYEIDLVTIRESEAVVLREMASRLLKGHGYKDIAYWLNEQGHRTTTGKLWYPITVRNMLQKKRYGGIRDYKGTEYPASWEPVFDADTWEQLQLTIRSKQGSPTPSRRYLLTGIAFCGKCGKPLNGGTKRDKADRPLRRTYYCRVQGDTKREAGCGGVVRNADALEHFMRECVLYRIDTPELGQLLQADNGQMSQLLDQHAQLTARINQLVDDYAVGLLDRAQLQRAKATAEAALHDVQAQLDKARGMSIGLDAGQTVRQAWLDNSDEWRRSLLSLLIKRIDVHVGKTKPFYMADGTRYRFDPSLIGIMWIN